MKNTCHLQLIIIRVSGYLRRKYRINQKYFAQGVALKQLQIAMDRHVLQAQVEEVGRKLNRSHCVLLANRKPIWQRRWVTLESPWIPLWPCYLPTINWSLKRAVPGY